MGYETRVEIASDADVVIARQRGRQLAAKLGFEGSELTLIATAISEVARNIVEYARVGEIILSPVNDGGRRGIVVVARDQGPGIADVELAMQDGYSTQKSLGLGLPGARRLMDEFEIVTEVGKGTTVTLRNGRVELFGKRPRRTASLGVGRRFRRDGRGRRIGRPLSRRAARDGCASSGGGRIGTR